MLKFDNQSSVCFSEEIFSRNYAFFWIFETAKNLNQTSIIYYLEMMNRFLKKEKKKRGKLDYHSCR